MPLNLIVGCDITEISLHGESALEGNKKNATSLQLQRKLAKLGCQNCCWWRVAWRQFWKGSHG
ncbi:conserved hypothetical protein [Ricinus communis]|uniref:Uncharacterized protein n=1 Tax=Ricinus communis TaxID=3988 RepID=B9T3S0_RICCO|nr:conserved hypothetical protein [Ricinus communis]